MLLRRERRLRVLLRGTKEADDTQLAELSAAGAQGDDRAYGNLRARQLLRGESHALEISQIDVVEHLAGDDRQGQPFSGGLEVCGAAVQLAAAGPPQFAAA